MSYSFSVRAATKTLAKAAISDELAKVVASQSVHAADRAQAQAAADAFVDLLPDDDTCDVTVNMHGSVSWSGTYDAPTISSAGVGITSALVKR